MPLKVISTHLDLSCRHRKRTAAIAKFWTIMQPDADDLAGPSRLISKRTAPGYASGRSGRGTCRVPAANAELADRRHRAGEGTRNRRRPYRAARQSASD